MSSRRGGYIGGHSRVGFGSHGFSRAASLTSLGVAPRGPKKRAKVRIPLTPKQKARIRKAAVQQRIEREATEKAARAYQSRPAAEPTATVQSVKANTDAARRLELIAARREAAAAKMGKVIVERRRLTPKTIKAEPA